MTQDERAHAMSVVKREAEMHFCKGMGRREQEHMD